MIFLLFLPRGSYVFHVSHIHYKHSWTDKKNKNNLILPQGEHYMYFFLKYPL